MTSSVRPRPRFWRDMSKYHNIFWVVLLLLLPGGGGGGGDRGDRGDRGVL